MQVTLRQAHKLVEKITVRLTTVEINATKSFNVWQLGDAATSLKEARDELKRTCTLHSQLVGARQQIRNDIRAANRVEIDDLVATRKGLLDLVSSLRALLVTVDSRAITTVSALEDKAEATRAASKGASHYGSTDEIAVCLLSADDQAEMDQQIQKYQLSIEAVEEQLTTASASAKITISADIAKVLRTEGLIA